MSLPGSRGFCTELYSPTSSAFTSKCPRDFRIDPLGEDIGERIKVNIMIEFAYEKGLQLSYDKKCVILLTFMLNF